MKRKLVKQGAATMMISLPAKWIKEFGLGKGDEVDIDQIESNLIISAKDIQKKTSIEIKLTGLMTESSIRTILTNTYRLGYENVKVSFDNESQLKVIKDVVKTSLLGFDVIKTAENYCIIENITEPSPDQFDVILQKIFYNISELFSITKKRLNDEETVEDYRDIEAKLQQYDNFCRRVIAKKQIAEKNAQLFWNFLTRIMHTQREIYHLNRFLDKNKIKVSKQVLNFLDEAEDLFELLKKAYLKKDILILEEMHKKEKELVYKEAYSLLSNIKGKENILVYHITASLRSTYLAASPLIGLLL